MLFSSGNCNSSYSFFCITATATKPMTVLRALAYFEFDFPLNLRKLIKQICNKMFTRMIIIFLLLLFFLFRFVLGFFVCVFFFLSLEKLLMHAISFRLSEAELFMHLIP